MIKLAILLSGSGTTANAIFKAHSENSLSGIQPAVVISSHSNAEGLEKARAFNIPTEIITKRDFGSADEFGNSLLKILESYEVELISQNGWLVLTPTNVIARYKGKIINQHPGPLDPPRLDFGGHGMYGARVVAARLIYCMLTDSDWWTEATTHYVEPEYDKGKIIRIERLDFREFKNSLSLDGVKKSKDEIIEKVRMIQQKLLPLEYTNVIATLQSFVDSNVPNYQRVSPLIPLNNTEALNTVKELAIEFFPHG